MRFSLFCRLAIIAFACSFAMAQTNPTPFDLSSGNYSVTQWDAASPARTFPPSMRFHMYSTTSSITTVEPLVLNYDMNSDWDSTYNLGSGARVNGLGVDGISLLNTSSSVYSPTRLFPSVVSALNTSNRVNIRVSWTGGTVVSQTRNYAIVLQYRVGTTDPWSTAIQNVSDTVQYKSSTTGNSQAMPTFTLPANCENQPVVQLRWRYYQWNAAASGSRPQMRLDEILVQSDASSGVPVKLTVSAITPTTPSVLTPFSATVQTLNAADQIRSVTQNTAVQLNLFTGSGTLAGTLTGTIASGTNTLVMTGLTYSVAEQGVQIQVVRTAGDFLTSGLSPTFTVLPRATQLTMTGVASNAFVNVALSSITVNAKRADNSIDLNYPGPITLSKVSGPGNIVGTLVQNPVGGVVTYSDITFDAPGTYVIAASGANVSTATSSAIVVVGQPNVVELIMPQYMAGRSITLPSFALVRLDNLQPNTAYRFYTAAAEINNLVGFAAGTNIHTNVDASTFNYVANSFSDFGTPGRYSQFVTGSAQTSKVMWVNMVPSSNSRFTAGNSMYWYLSLRDTTRSIETRFITTGTTKTLNISTAAGDGTGISDTASTCDPKTVICLYDNTTGTGSPLSTALVEDDATTVPGAPVFYTNVEAKRTAWATLIPNTLVNGVRRVEQRSLVTGAIMKVWVDDDGIWTPVSTVNPRFGNAAVIFPTPQVQFPISLTGKSFCSTQPAIITWTSRGVATVDLQISVDGINYTTFASAINASLGSYAWTIPDNLAGGNNLRLRIVDTDRPTTVFDVTGYVNVNTPAIVTKDPVSQDACLGGSVTLSIQANGSALTYQWEKDGLLLIGRTSPILTITSVTQGTSGLYRCLLNGGSGCPGTSSKFALISTLPELTIVGQPKSISAPNGGVAFLSVEASVQSGVRYQWYRGTTPMADNTRINGTQSSTMTIRNIVATDFADNYLCRVTSICGTVSSNNASISSANITVTQQPTAAAFCLGADGSFSAAATSSSPGVTISYQWLKNGAPLSDNSKYTGTKTSVLTVVSVVVGDSGKYSCKVTASNGAVAFTNQVSLTSRTAPKVTAQSGLARKCNGESATLSVTVSDTTGAQYQWWYKNVAVSGATNSNHTVTVGSETIGAYICLVSNACGSDTARGCSVELIAATKVNTQPRKETKLLEGGTILLSIDASASKMHLQWFFNGKAIEGDTLPNLSILNAKGVNAGAYTCLVTGDCGAVLSDTAFVLITSSVDELSSFGFSLLSTSPNPAGAVANINYELNADRMISLTLCDFLGRPVTTLFEGMQSAGVHNSTLRCDELPSGTYFVYLRSGDAVISKRMAVIH